MFYPNFIKYLRIFDKSSCLRFLETSFHTMKQDSRCNFRRNFDSRRNFNKLVLEHLNINSLRNKFDALTQQITGNVDTFMLLETKLDSSFPESQFLIPGYSTPYRVDRTCHGGGLLLFVREDIPSKLLLTVNAPIEGFYTEINLRKKKWLICGSYNLHRTTIGSHMDSLSKNLALYLYENYIVLGNFNAEVHNNSISSFCDAFDLVNLIREPIC